MSAIMLAAATGAELMVAPAFTRGSFATDEFSTPWVPLPIDQLLDMPHVVRHWQQRGLIIHPVRLGACLLCQDPACTYGPKLAIGMHMHGVQRNPVCGHDG
jgi:hypothetical protein